MKKFKTRFISAMQGLFARIVHARNTILGAATVGMLSYGPYVHAADDPSEIVGDIVDTVVDIFPYIGVFLVIAGIFKLVMAYRTDQPEGQSSAAKDIVIGAVLFAFRVFMWEPISSALGL